MANRFKVELRKNYEATWYDSDDSVYASVSSIRDEEYGDGKLVDYDELEDFCVSDMTGLRILLVEKIATDIWNKMCCKM